MMESPPKAPFLNTNKLGIRFLHTNGGGGHKQSVAVHIVSLPTRNSWDLEIQKVVLILGVLLGLSHCSIFHVPL